MQRAFWDSPARFNVVPAGRRAGKSELCRRRGVAKAIGPQVYPDAHYVFGAPTHQQAKRIFWSDIKRMVPHWALAGGDPRTAISETDLTIRFASGAEIIVFGMDRPERIEGPPIDWICVDEIANVKKETWDEHIRPALSERNGHADLIGVPEGRNHYYQLSLQAQEEQAKHPQLWGHFSWPSSDILPAEEIAIARAELDELTFRQEYEARFLNFQGVAYYAFSRHVHAAEPLRYDPGLPLILAFDFNVSPGVCAILQEQTYRGDNRAVDRSEPVTCVLDEIWIPRDSNTRRVCGQIIERYRGHQQSVYCYGDATGGAKGTAAVEGSDWDLIKDCLRPVFGQPFMKASRGDLIFRVPRANPRERVRVNAVNSRLQSADGTVRLLVDPVKCPHTIMDLEGVTCKDDGSGEIDKKGAPMLTHLTDAIGYYVYHEHPLRHRETIFEQM